MLINQGIERAQYFANLIKKNPDFELITEPELCLLTYRYVPSSLQKFMATAHGEQNKTLNGLLDRLTKSIQKSQRENGRSFVSRTRIEVEKYQNHKTLVFRVVLANPLTSEEILTDILQEQVQLAAKSLRYFPELKKYTK